MIRAGGINGEVLPEAVSQGVAELDVNRGGEARGFFADRIIGGEIEELVAE